MYNGLGNQILKKINGLLYLSDAISIHVLLYFSAIYF
jgi:hypothetical protein